MVEIVPRYTTWRQELTTTFAEHGETFADVEAITLSEAELDKEFTRSYMGPVGAPFTVWTKKRVYFPFFMYGNAEVESVSRHPDGKPTDHINIE